MPDKPSDKEASAITDQPASDELSTPVLISPPQTNEPSTEETKKANGNVPRARDAPSEPIDSEALSHALSKLEKDGRQREHTPGSSPSRKRQRIYNDRFIPNREGRDLRAGFSLLHDDASPATPSKSKKRTPHNELHFQRTEEANKTYSTLLRSELFGGSVPIDFPDTGPQGHSGARPRSRTPTGIRNSISSMSGSPSTPHKNLFTYQSPRNFSINSPSKTPSGARRINLDTRSELYSLSPVKMNNQEWLTTPRKQPRNVSKVPYKVLDAPELADDFYLNLVDWGNSNNILGVGLKESVYLWNSGNGRVFKLTDFPDDPVTSVNWVHNGPHLAIGTHKGYVQIWDAEKQKRLRTMTGHYARVGSLAWNQHILSSGSRDRTILHRDVRSSDQFIQKLSGHKQEICGLKWNVEDCQLASGGNDNKLMVWDKLNREPLYKFSEHNAAVKAISWSPHQRSLLASGGGTADRKIRFWNTKNGSLIRDIDTGSQVCNLAWSKNSNELVSTHGYSQNQIVVWQYPKMSQVVSLTGHTYRVLYLAMSPDGQIIVTGAGDETLRFWNCFKKRASGSLGFGGQDDRDSIR